MAITIQRRALGSLKLDPHNARLHEERSIDGITRSLVAFGQVEPLVVQKSTSKIIGGNGRLEAMQKLGWEEADVVEVDVDDLTATKLALSLNRTAELSTWDAAELARTLEELSAGGDWMPEAVGFSSKEVDDIILANAPLPSNGEPREFDESIAAAAHGSTTCPSCGREFSA